MSNNVQNSTLIDHGIALLGVVVAWCVPVMAVTVCAIVVLRYGFSTGAIAAQESVQYLHAALFMLGAAVTMGADQHVRVDVFYRRFTPRQKAWVNTLGHIIFTLPLCALIGVSSFGYVLDSWSAFETSPEPGGLPLVYVLKTLIPAMAVLLALQAVAQIGRGVNMLCRKDPS